MIMLREGNSDLAFLSGREYYPYWELPMPRTRQEFAKNSPRVRQETLNPAFFRLLLAFLLSSPPLRNFILIAIRMEICMAISLEYDLYQSFFLRALRFLAFYSNRFH